MGFFTLGNLLTLGIVGLVLILYRQLDRQSHALNKVHKYADKLRIDLADFVAEKEAAVKDYGISLDVQQKSAKELMKRLQMTNEDLALKAAAVTKIDERISAYDGSLEELVRMTARVQENLNRIREESAFVEQVNKRVGEAKEKFVTLEKGLGEIERRFTRENTDFLEKTAQSLIGELQSQISELQASAEVIRQRMEEDRATLDHAERIRAEQMSRDLNLINNALQAVMEQIASEADKLEDAALVKLREQAQRRILQLQSSIEEALKTHQEQAQAQITEFQEAVTAYKQEWKEDVHALEVQHRSYKETLERELQDLTDHIQVQRQDWTQAVEKGNTQVQQLFTDLKALQEQSRVQVTQERAALAQQLTQLRESTESTVQALEERLVKAVADAEQRALELTDERIEQWKQVTLKAADTNRNLLADLEQASAETKERVSVEILALEQQFKGVQIHTLDSISALEQQLLQVAEDAEQRVLKLTDERLEHWKLVTAEADANTQQMLSALELSTAEIEAHFVAETLAQEQRLRDLQIQTDEALRSLKDQIMKAAADTEVKVLEDAGARLEQWKAAAEAGDARSRELLASFQGAVGLLRAQVNKETATIEQHIQDVQVHTDEAIMALKNHVVKAAEDTQAKIWSDTEARLEQWKVSVEESEHQVRQLLKALEGVSAESEQHVFQVLAGIGGRVDALQTKVDETTSHITAQLAQAAEIGEKQGKALADGELEKWNRAAEVALTKAQQNCAAWEASFAMTKQQVSDDIAEVFGQCKAVQDHSKEVAAQIQVELAQAALTAEEKALALVDTGLNRWIEAAETGDTKARTLLAEVERVSTETKARMFDELAVAEARVETVQQDIQETAVLIEAKMLDAMNEAKDKVLVLMQAELDQWNHSVEQVHTQTQTLRSQMETLAGESEKNLAALETRLTNLVAETEQRFSDSSEKRLEQWKIFTLEADTQTKAVLASLENTTAETKTQVAAEHTALEQRLQDLHTYTDQRISALETQVEQRVRDTEQQVQEAGEAQLEAWKQATATEETHIRDLFALMEVSFADTKQQLSDCLTATEARLDSLQQRLDETAASIDQGMAQAISAAEARGLALADLGLEQWKQAVEVEDTAIQGLLSSLKNTFEVTKQQMTDELAAAEARLDTVQERLDQTAATIDQGMAQAIRTAEERALAAADVSLDKWKQTVEAEDTHIQGVLRGLQASCEASKQQVSDELAAAEARLDTFKQRLDETAATIEQSMSQAIAAVEAQARVLVDAELEQWNQTLEAGLAKTKCLLADLEASFEQTKQQLVDELTITDERMDRIQQDLEEASGLIEHEMVQAVDNAADKALVIADERFQKWKEATEAEEAKTQAMLSGLEASCEATKQAVSHELTDTEARLDTLKQRLDEVTALIEHEMAQAVGNAEEKARALADAGVEHWKQATEAKEVKTQAILADIEASLARTQEQAGEAITGIKEQLETLHGRIQETAAYMEQTMTQALVTAEEKAMALGDTHFEIWQQTVAEKDATAQQVLAAMEGSFTATKQQLEQVMSTAEQRFQTLQSQISEAASHIESDLAQAMKSAEEKARVAADAELEQWKQTVAAENRKTQALLAALETASEATKTKAALEYAALEARLQELHSYTDGAVDTLKTQVEKTLWDTEQQILQEAQVRLEPWKQTIEEADTKAQALLTALETASEETKVRLDAEGTAMEQRLTAFHAYTNEAIEGLKIQVEQKLRETEQQALEHREARFKAWAQQLQEADIKARTELSALEASFAATKQQVSETIGAAEQQFQALQNRVSEAASHIEHELAQAAQDAQAQAQVLADTGLEQWKQAAAAEDAKARHILADMEKIFGDTQQQLRDTMSATEQQVQTLHHKIGEAAAQLERTMTQVLESTEAQARAMADTGLEQWKQAVEAEQTKAQALLSTLETASTETKTQLAAEQASIEQRLKDLQAYTDQVVTRLKAEVTQTLTDTEQQILEDAHAQLEQWNQTAAAEDAKTRALLSTLEATASEAKTYLDAENDALEQRLKDLQLYTDEAIGSLRTQVEKTVKETEQQARDEVLAQIEQWHRTVTEMEGSFMDIKRQASDEITVAEQYLETLQNKVGEVSVSIEAELARTVEQAEAKAMAATNKGIEQWKQAAEASQGQIQQMLTDVAISSGELEKALLRESETMQLRLQELQTYTNDRLVQMKQQLQEVAEETEQKVLEEADAKFAEYRQAQAEQFSRMETLADDSAALDTELRRYMQDLENRVRADFTRFEQQAAQDRDRMVQEFTASAETLTSMMEGIEKELAVLKTQAYEKVSEKLQVFETDFAEDLSLRNKAIDQQLVAWQEALDTRLAGMGAESEAQRRALEVHFTETLHTFKGQLEQVSTQAGVQQAQIFTRIDEQAQALEAAIKEAEQHIKDFTAQTQLFEQANELKRELDQRIEGLKGELDHLDQHWTEAADIEDEFVKIKRLEEEVNAKMTRFLSEKHRIEQLETDFNRLLLVSEAVEDKLSAISTSNDTLQEMQIQIRKLTDALGNAEEKYQRLEKKNQTLDITNDGIDRNFKSLQESEKRTQAITQDLHRLSDEAGALRSALETLNQDNKKARETADNLSLLDQSLSTIEDRIEDMQKARKWLAEIETRLEKLNKEAQEQVKLMGGLMKDGGKLAPQDKGAPPLGVRDNIIRLARLGWTVDEIARAVKCGKGEVELILEIMPKE